MLSQETINELRRINEEFIQQENYKALEILWIKL